MIKLYGAERCHKTQYYKTFLETRNLDYAFLDVEHNEDFAEELESEVKENQDKNIIIAGHHPVVSFGNYGGHFSFFDHLKPFNYWKF